MATAPRIARRLQTWLLTGPVGHFVAGALDFTTALTRYALARRGRKAAPAKARLGLLRAAASGRRSPSEVDY